MVQGTVLRHTKTIVDHRSPLKTLYWRGNHAQTRTEQTWTCAARNIEAKFLVWENLMRTVTNNQQMLVQPLQQYSFIMTSTCREVCRISTRNYVCVSEVTVILLVIIPYLTEEITYVYITTLYSTTILRR